MVASPGRCKRRLSRGFLPRSCWTRCWTAITPSARPSSASATPCGWAVDPKIRRINPPASLHGPYGALRRVHGHARTDPRSRLQVPRGLPRESPQAEAPRNVSPAQLGCCLALLRPSHSPSGLGLNTVSPGSEATTPILSGWCGVFRSPPGPGWGRNPILAFPLARGRNSPLPHEKGEIREGVSTARIHPLPHPSGIAKRRGRREGMVEQSRVAL